jgi:hypothetical protein
MTTPFQSVQQFVGEAYTNVKESVSQAAGNLEKTATYAKAKAEGFMKDIRSKNLPTAGEPPTKTVTKATVNNPNGEADWRVRLSIPDVFSKSPIMNQLHRTNGFVFPFTPTIIMQHSANYNSLQPMHTNYPYFNYQNSQVDAITIAGDFFVENKYDAEYWIAAVHYLRSCTKMFYGQNPDGLNGSPLNGYGDYIFDNVPVIITNFMVDMPQDVDYIRAEITAGSRTNGNSGPAQSWVPSQCTFTVTVQPIYSRTKASKFSLTDFVSGKYIGSNKGYL